MTMTIDLVDDTDENGDGSHQGSIDNEPSAGEKTQRPSCGTSEQNLKNRDGSKGIHLLVSYDQGVIGDSDDFEQKGQHRELEDPMCCREASLGDIQLMIDEPKTHWFDDDDGSKCKKQQNVERRAEHSVHLSLFSSSQFIGDESLHRRSKAIAEHSEHRHHRTHNAKDTQVIDSQIRKSESRGPKVEPHREQHASVEQASVAHDALLAIGGGGCSVAFGTHLTAAIKTLFFSELFSEPTVPFSESIY